jgi:hypothetical protein
MAKEKADQPLQGQALLDEAQRAYEAGEPLPPGVGHNVYLSPHFFLIDEDTGEAVLPEDVQPVAGATAVAPQTAGTQATSTPSANPTGS